MNLGSGHKRINSYSGQSSNYSGQKVNPRNTIIQGSININMPLQKKSGSKETFGNNIKLIHPVGTSSGTKHGKGSIIYHNTPLKFEGDLMSKTQQNRDNSRNNVMSRVPNQSEKENLSATASSSNVGQGGSTHTRSLSPNTLGKKVTSTPNVNFKSNPGLGKPSMTLSRFKKLDLPTSNATKGMTKKTKSYYIPKSARDTLNLSNISGISNKNKFNETKDSFASSYTPGTNMLSGINSYNNSNNISGNLNLNVSDMNKRSKSGSKPLSAFNNLKGGIGNLNFGYTGGRSTTPNARASRNTKLSDSKFTKSNNDLHSKVVRKSPSPNVSKSPNSRLNNSSLSTTKKVSNLNKFSPGMKNVFDSSLIKQLNDFKNNKTPTPNILKKITNNPKIMNISAAKFGAPNVKKVITGNLINMNMNVNVTNLNVNLQNPGSENNTINSSNNVGVSSANAFTINNNMRKDSKDFKENLNNEEMKNGNTPNQGSNNIINNFANIRNNLHKERESKGQVDFKEMNTSPLLRDANLDEEKEEIAPNTNIGSKNVNPGVKANPTILSINSHSSISTQNQPKIVKKNIKLIHEFSKVGFSGYGVKKTNQDNYFVFKNFVGNPNHYYMAVCDGHGVLGHEVSGYLRENLPVNLNNYLKSKNKNVLTQNIHSIIEDIFLDINYKLHTDEIIDTTFSGSTCVSCIYTPEKIITANVGDSRAVIGRCVNGEWKSHDLSRDHKPNEKDEAARIRKKGGRIQPFKDEDGEFIGPPRVWLKEDDIPGLAMSRSFGDRVAASVGVIAEPEITEYKFHEDDKFMIIASDGVWEFIESAEDYYLKNDIVGCCEFIHKESSTRWMKEEEVIDDISMIICFFE